MTATHEFVVPRSIPITLAIDQLLLAAGRLAGPNGTLAPVSGEVASCVLNKASDLGWGWVEASALYIRWASSAIKLL
jgi:hypothetical protein